MSVTAGVPTWRCDLCQRAEQQWGNLPPGWIDVYTGKETDRWQMPEDTKHVCVTCAQKIQKAASHKPKE